MNVLAICGSTRAQSSNKRYLTAIGRLGHRWAYTLYEGLAALPAFNPDIDPDNPPPSVRALLELLSSSDGVVICTPEYAMGVPGALKNAIDWTVAASAFSGKPTALVTASLDGRRGHAALMETLKVIEARMSPETELVISHAQTKIDASGVITDSQTRDRLAALVEALEGLMG